jgi:hypothetical protein
MRVQVRIVGIVRNMTGFWHGWGEDRTSVRRERRNLAEDAEKTMKNE